MNAFYSPNGGTLTAVQIKTVKRACKYMGLTWQSVAARPVVCKRIFNCIKANNGNMREACRMFAEINNKGS